MSDELKHECGVALLRLRQSQSYFQRKYNVSDYGLQKLALLLEKQHNRGQDGAGIAAMKLQAVPGEPYYQLEKCNTRNPLAELMGKIADMDPLCELFLGHLRYGTFGRQSLSACHPILRESSCRNRTLFLAGNFNLTNTAKLFQSLIDSGHHLNDRQDSLILMTLLAHQLEKQLDRNGGTLPLDLPELLRTTASDWDGGFHICGMIGNGDAFAFRDAAGIRPGYYYFDDEIAVVASERPAIQTAFDLSSAEVMELPPGNVLLIERGGNVRLQECLPPRKLRRCVFERIYFSRGNDADIHRERRELGRRLTPAVLNAVDHDFANTVFSYIPNTAQISFHGLLDELYCENNNQHIRFSQIAVKDAKFRTFITDTAKRKDLGMHVYDVTYGVIRPGADNLVVLDDSIVRGNTMRNAILRILDRLGPKRIVVASAAPPICYPDGYGIDMASLGELVAFEAAIRILKRRGDEKLLAQCVEAARADLRKPDEEMKNRVKPIYDSIPFPELCDEIGNCLRPPDLKAELKVVFQTCQNLRASCPEHTGDWYFSGNYPTPGGNRVVNRALINYIDKINQRAY